MTESSDYATGPAQALPVAGQVYAYAVPQPDGSTRHQLILITGAAAEGKVLGVPVGWADEQAEFAAGQLA